MTDDTVPQGTIPPDPPQKKPPAPLTRGMLIWFGVGFVVLAFVAAFLGSWLARSVDAPEAESTPTPTPVATEGPDYEEVLAEILPAGSAVRAGQGVPESGKGYEGDVYIDLLTSDVYLFQDDWTWVGNIRESAAANLTGETGATGAQGPAGEQGAQGAQGEQGEQGEAGTPGTQVVLGTGVPDDETCTADGDVFIDTAALAFYTCADGEWMVSPSPEGVTSTPSPSPTAEG